MNAAATTSLQLTERAEAFAAEVRSNLADLPSDELDDLLDGLGADLAERLSDGGELGDAAQYADELRQAAGLPPREAMPEVAVKVAFGERMGEWISAKRMATAAWFAATPARAGFRDFAVTLKPLWWVIRAMVVSWAALAFVGHPMVNGLQVSFFALALNAIAIVVSVQWGRGKWLPNAFLKVTYNIARVAAVVLLLPVLVFSWAMLNTPTPAYVDASPPYVPGLHTNGEQVTNIFAYDCEGNLLDSVRLFDQDGNPIDTNLIDGWGENDPLPYEFWDEQAQAYRVMYFNPLAVDAEAWNVFPLTTTLISNNTGEPGKAEGTLPKKDELAPLSRDCGAAGEPGSTAENGAEGTVDSKPTDDKATDTETKPGE